MDDQDLAFTLVGLAACSLLIRTVFLAIGVANGTAEPRRRAIVWLCILCGMTVAAIGAAVVLRR